MSADAPSDLCFREGAHKRQKICTSLPLSLLQEGHKKGDFFEKRPVTRNWRKRRDFSWKLWPHTLASVVLVTLQGIILTGSLSNMYGSKRVLKPLGVVLLCYIAFFVLKMKIE